MDLGDHRFFSKSDWMMQWWQEILPVASEAREEAKSLDLAHQGQLRVFPPSSAPATDPDKVSLVRPRLSRIYYLRSYFDYPVKLNGNTVRNLGPARMAAIGISCVKSRMAPRSS